ncbi:Abi-alpha family protein [Ideonella paludis]
MLNVRREYKQQTPEKSGGKDVMINFSLLGQEANLEFPHLTPTYIDNLCRLGLAEVRRCMSTRPLVSMRP